MRKDARLERLSDDVRRGVPIDFMDALAVIVYQCEKQASKKKVSLLQKIKQGLYSIVKKDA